MTQTSTTHTSTYSCSAFSHPNRQFLPAPKRALSHESVKTLSRLDYPFSITTNPSRLRAEDCLARRARVSRAGLPRVPQISPETLSNCPVAPWLVRFQRRLVQGRQLHHWWRDAEGPAQRWFCHSSLGRRHTR